MLRMKMSQSNFFVFTHTFGRGSYGTIVLKEVKYFWCWDGCLLNIYKTIFKVLLKNIYFSFFDTNNTAELSTLDIWRAFQGSISNLRRVKQFSFPIGMSIVQLTINADVLCSRLKIMVFRHDVASIFKFPSRVINWVKIEHCKLRSTVWLLKYIWC